MREASALLTLRTQGSIIIIIIIIIIVRVCQGWILDTLSWIVSTHSCPAWQTWFPQGSCKLCPPSVSVCRSGLVFFVLLCPVLVPKGPTGWLSARDVVHSDLPAEASNSWFYLRHILIQHRDLHLSYVFASWHFEPFSTYECSNHSKVFPSMMVIIHNSDK